ncbi:P1 family peptidase [Dialister sp. UBA1703]|uniref:P1 family peptidase n=1 Tax=Dialister sp. UBA1703 TaxID=1946415 RepID=UPI0025BE2C3D|nr:P1 family peptidase [Dialister sp. UBA1703]
METRTLHVPGFAIGTAEDRKGLTGVTVILAPEGGAAAGVDVRGCAPGTRETDLLSPEKTVQKIHAVVLSGGSAFGLESDCGVMNFLAEKGIGFPVGDVTVPIVCGAVLFDLSIGDPKVHPGLVMGYEAASRASNTFPVGCYGAGTGASVGKLRGFDHAMKSGAGYAEFSLPSGLFVGAYMAVNACGEIYDKDEILAGALADDDAHFISSHELMMQGFKRQTGTNTSIGCVMTNARLTKAECKAVSGMAHDGYARAIRPVHTTMDGDTVFTMASGEVEAPVDTVGYLAEEAIRLAILDAVKNAESMGGRPAYRNIIT